MCPPTNHEPRRPENQRSRNWAVWDWILEALRSDALRYYLTVNMPEMKDRIGIGRSFGAQQATNWWQPGATLANRVLFFCYKNF